MTTRYPPLILLAFAWTLVSAGAQTPLYVPGERDYLPADLRERVESLKRDAASPPRGRDAILDRAKVVWSWSNAFAMAGGHVHENAPFVVGQTLQGGPPLLFIRQLPMLVRDLDLKERVPDALGTVTLEPTGPFPAGSHQTIRQTITIGPVDLTEGGHIFLGRKSPPTTDSAKPPIRPRKTTSPYRAAVQKPILSVPPLP